MDYVAVDLGASSTRYTTVDNKINFIPNNMFFVRDMSEKLTYSRNGDVVENNLDVSIWKDGESKYFPMRALVGQMAARCSKYNDRPEQLKSKHDQAINYFSTILAVALSKLKVPELSEDINLFSALPPAEVEMYKDVFRQNLVGHYTVSFNKIGPSPVTVQFNIKDVYCYEESRMALVQFLLDDNYPDRITKFGNSTIMSIDIGASTTDIAIFDKTQYIERTGRTYKVGGNTVREIISKSLMAKYSTEFSVSEVEQCLIEGRIKNGNKYDVISDIVESAKMQVARQIASQLDQYFSSIQMSIMSINYIVVSGGGSMDSSYIADDGQKISTSKPMSEYITQALRSICPNIDVVFFGDEPRTANIRGLGMYAAVCNGEVES